MRLIRYFQISFKIQGAKIITQKYWFHRFRILFPCLLPQSLMRWLVPIPPNLCLIYSIFSQIWARKFSSTMQIYQSCNTIPCGACPNIQTHPTISQCFGFLWLYHLILRYSLIHRVVYNYLGKNPSLRNIVYNFRTWFSFIMPPEFPFFSKKRETPFFKK